MKFTFNDEKLIKHLNTLPITPTSKYGDIISMADINSLTPLYNNNPELLKTHLTEAEQHGVINIIHSDIDYNLFNGVKLL